jgi:hypothetical protein
MEIIGYLALVLAAAAAAYLAWVNRPLQHYRGSFFVAAAPDETADALTPIPGQPYLAEQMVVEAVDAEGKDMRLVLPNGAETRFRIIEDQRPRQIVFEGVTRRNPQANWGDRIFSRESVAAVPGGSVVNYEIRVERAAIGTGFMMRLAYPFQGRFYRWMIESEIERRRKARSVGPWGKA